MEFKLSDQAIGALMLALQKGIMEGCDITELLRDFSLLSTADGLIVENPPLIEVNKTQGEDSLA